MPRRVSLPAADELFRTTGGSAVQPSSPANQNHANGEEPSGKSAPSTTRVPAPVGEQDSTGATEATEDGDAGGRTEDGGQSEHSAAGEADDSAGEAGAAPGGGPATAGGGEHSGREGGEGQEGRSVPRPSVPGQGTSQAASGGGGRADSDAQIPSRRTGQAAPAGSPAKSPQQPKSPRAAEPRSRQQAAGSPRRGGGRGANRRPSGRERHDEKITVYVSAEELMDLEHARLVLRGEHGLAVDRGRIVREAVAVVLADLESRGDASILVRRLRGR